jgi:hypothetical protein
MQPYSLSSATVANSFHITELDTINRLNRAVYLLAVAFLSEVTFLTLILDATRLVQTARFRPLHEELHQDRYKRICLKDAVCLEQSI